MTTNMLGIDLEFLSHKLTVDPLAKVLIKRRNLAKIKDKLLERRPLS